MQGFDIYPSEKHQVVFVVISPHLDSFAAIVDQILSEGFLLSRINVLYNPAAKSAAMVYDYKTHNLTVTWKAKKAKNPPTVNYFENAQNLGRLVERIMCPPQDDCLAKKRATQ